MHFFFFIQETTSNKSAFPNVATPIESEDLPIFSNGDPCVFPIFLVAIQDLVLSNDSLSPRAKYRKIFCALSQSDQRLLSQKINPSNPDLNEVIKLLRKKYEAFIRIAGYIDVDQSNEPYYWTRSKLFIAIMRINLISVNLFANLYDSLYFTFFYSKFCYLLCNLFWYFDNNKAFTQ